MRLCGMNVRYHVGTLTYFKCVDTLLTYCNKSIPEEPSLWFAIA